MKRITRNYCCIDCGNLIERHTALYKSGKCKSCAQSNKILSLKTKNKISLAHVGKRLSKETKMKISVAHKGKDNGRLGIKHTKESKLKISRANKGRKHSLETKRKLSKLLKGKTRSNEHCLALSKACRGIKRSKDFCLKISRLLKGNGNPNWQGGLDKEGYPYYFSDELKQKIRERDNFICKCCGITQDEYGKNLSIHHIDYNKQNCKENNLITVCNICNVKANYNRDYWFAYYTYLLGNR